MIYVLAIEMLGIKDGEIPFSMNAEFEHPQEIEENDKELKEIVRSSMPMTKGTEYIMRVKTSSSYSFMEDYYRAQVEYYGEMIEDGEGYEPDISYKHFFMTGE